MIDFSIEPLAEDALLMRFGDGVDVAINARVHAAARALRAAALAPLVDIAPAYATLLLRIDRSAVLRTNPAKWREDIVENVRSIVDGALKATSSSPESIREQRRRDEVTIPVCYGGTYGPDVEVVAAHTGLGADQVIARHAGAGYMVAMLGFAPGFPYLLGLDPVLHMPRRAEPRTRVRTGSVAIGGAQTGIYPRELPGGWHLIGRTPLTLFDPARETPCLLAPGTRVRFQPIGGDDFERLAGHGD